MNTLEQADTLPCPHCRKSVKALTYERRPGENDDELRNCVVRGPYGRWVALCDECGQPWDHDFIARLMETTFGKKILAGPEEKR